MALRTATVLVSLMLHGFAGTFLWSRMQLAASSAIEVGEAQDVFLEPEGIVASEVSSVGNDVQSIETQQTVSLNQELPPLATIAPVEQHGEFVENPQLKDAQEVAPGSTVHGVMPSALAEQGSPASERLEPTPMSKLVAAETQEPPTMQPALALPDKVASVIASEQSDVREDTGRGGEVLSLVGYEPKEAPSANSSAALSPIETVTPPEPLQSQLDLFVAKASIEPRVLQEPADLSPEAVLGGRDDYQLVRSERPSPLMPIENKA